MSGSGWVQLYIKTTRTAQELTRVDPLLMMFSACFIAPDGVPIQTKEDMYEVRVQDARHVRFVERVLADHGLVIAARDDHEVPA